VGQPPSFTLLRMTRLHSLEALVALPETKMEAGGLGTLQWVIECRDILPVLPLLQSPAAIKRKPHMISFVLEGVDTGG
jgi:hypothetical protein